MDWSFLTETVLHLLAGVPLFAAVLVVLIGGRFLIFLTTPLELQEDLQNAGNPAASVLLGAFLLSAGIALTGTLFGRDEDSIPVATVKILVEGAVALLLLRLSIWINDCFILRHFNVMKEIRTDKNLGTAFCVAGSCIASGLILNGALTGFSSSFLHGLRDIVIYWLLGQLMLTMGAFVYQRMARYDVHQLIEYDDNAAVGLSFGAFLVCLGVIGRAALVGAGLGAMTSDLPRSMLLALAGTVGVIALNSVAMLIVSFRINFEDEVEMHGSIAVSTVTACAMLAAATALSAIIQR